MWLDFDQRGTGFPRAFGGQIDIGSFEAQTAVQPPELPGDYNVDGTVDAADYTVWRNALGTSGIEPYSGADGDGNGRIEAADFGVWKSNFGETLQTGSSSGSAAISLAPESQPMALSVGAVDAAFAMHQSPTIHFAGGLEPCLVQPTQRPVGEQALLLFLRRRAGRGDSAEHVDAIASREKASLQTVPSTIETSIFVVSGGTPSLQSAVLKRIFG